MTRRQAREHIFMMLFQMEFHKNEERIRQADIYLETFENMSDEDLKSLKEDIESNDSNLDFESLSKENIEELKERFFKIVEKLPEIDETISEISTGWTIDRMIRSDLTAMRIAVYEIKFDEEIPGPVSINEAVELAKKFGEETSGSFVNGVLAKLLT